MSERPHHRNESASRAVPSAVLAPLLLALTVVSASGCDTKTAAVSSASTDAVPAASSVTQPLRRRPITTSAGIALGNLDGDIAERIRANDATPSARLRLVDLLLARGEYLGRIADLEQADDLAKGTAARFPQDADARLARALTHAALHRFDAASAELDEAARRGAPLTRVAATRSSIALARGDYDEADALLRRAVGRPAGAADAAVESSGDVLAIATAAVIAGRMQKLERAEHLFDVARDAYRDVSPFPLAWMDFQRASVLAAHGREDAARRYFEEACEVLPPYAHAAVHLAASEAPERAIERLSAVLETSDDPDVFGGLAAAHERAGLPTEAAHFAARARARFVDLVARHRAAFADHAARFYLGQGNDPNEALSLARENAELRPSEEALDLWMAAGAAASRRDDVCAAGAKIDGLRYASARAQKLAHALLSSCSDRHFTVGGGASWIGRRPVPPTNP